MASLMACGTGSEERPVVDTGSADSGDASVDSFLAETASDTSTDTGTDGEARPDAPPSEPITLAALADGLRGIAAGPTSVFVTSFAGLILEIQKAGGEPKTFAKVEWPTHVVVDGTHVYWNDVRKFGGDPGSIGRLALEGGSPTVLSSDLTRPQGIALGAGEAFFTSSNTVFKVPKGGGSTSVVAADQPFAQHVAANADRVCWLSSGAVPTIACAPVSGGAPIVLAVEATLSVRALALDATHAFWVLGDGSLRSVALSGGAPNTLAPASDPCSQGDLALDATHAFWSCGPNVREVGKGGLGAVTLHRAVTDVRGVAVDATHVYWTTAKSNLVQKLPK